MKIINLKILMFSLLLIFSKVIYSQNIHVAVDGSDATGNGSINNPYATLTEASSNVSPGDTIFVHGGTYHNANFGDGDIWKNEILANIICNGTPDDYIVIMPYPGDNVLLEFDSTKGVQIKNSSYVIFSGFNIKGPGEGITFEEVQNAWGLYKDVDGIIHDLAVEMGIDITDPSLWGQTLDKPVTDNITKPNYYNNVGLSDLLSHHIIMENNTVSWAGSSGIRIQKSDYTTVRNNTVIYNTLRTTVGSGALTMAVSDYNGAYHGNTIINNTIHHNENQIYSWAPSKSFIHFVIDEGSGIFLTRNNENNSTTGYTYIANNLSYNNGASGIVIHKTNGVIVEHNTVFNNGETNGDSKAGGIGFNTAVDVTFRNNISWSKENKNAIGQVGGNNENLVFENNLVFNNNGSVDVVKNVPDGTYNEVNPEFFDVDNFDFNLSGISPAIDSGSTNSLVTNDFADFPRNDGLPDIGAYEYNPDYDTVDFPEKKSKELFVYPNPAKNKITICLNSDDLNSLKLFDIIGKEQKLIFNSTEKDKAETDLNNLPKGIYILTSKNTSIKIIKN